MRAGAQLSVTDLRSAARHAVDFQAIGEHRSLGDMPLHVTNLSAHGFMVDDSPSVARGDRVIVRLPVIGRIEAYCIWIADSRAGFQFERIIRFDDFDLLICELKPDTRHRRRG